MTYSDNNNADIFIEPLSLSTSSREGGLDDCFDLLLDDSARKFFSDSIKTNAEEDLADILGDSNFLCDSNFSADIDRMFEEDSPVEYDSTCFDSMQEKSQPPPPSLLKQGMQQVQTVKTNFSHGYNCVRGKSRRRNSQPNALEVEVGKVGNFDPAPYDHEKYQKMKRSSGKRSSCSDLDSLMEANNSSSPPSSSSRRRSSKGGNNSRSRRSGRPQRRATVDCAPPMHQPKQRRVTVDSAMAPSLSQLFGHRNSLDGNGMMPQEDYGPREPSFHYHEALQKLADSMKRTELSRRQLAMQRTVSTSSEVHQRIHDSAQQQLYLRVAGGNNNGRSTSNDSLNMIADQQQQHHPISPNPNNDRSSVMEAFFSGSRGTLTNGLEQSRMQLQMLAGQTTQRF